MPASGTNLAQTGFPRASGAAKTLAAGDFWRYTAAKQGKNRRALRPADLTQS
jgi:hypothetical protein